MSDNIDYKFETIAQMDLSHLPNNARLIIQKQTSKDISEDKHQFGLPTTFVNKDNGQTVWSRGPSIQLEQIPELVKLLTETYEKYSGKKYSGKKFSETNSEKTNTFADMYEK